MAMNFSRITGDETRGLFVNAETKEQSKQWMHTRSAKKSKKVKQTLSACQKADGNCFLEQKRSDNGGINATRDHNEVRSVLRDIKLLRRAIQSKMHGMLTYGALVVFLHDNAGPHTAASTRTLMENLNWELFDHPPYSPDLAPSGSHLFTRTYQKNWLGSQRFNNNEELMEDVETWLSSQAADLFDTGIQKLIPRYKCANFGGDYVEKKL
jgi:hypothetical protein